MRRRPLQVRTVGPCKENFGVVVVEKGSDSGWAAAAGAVEVMGPSCNLVESNGDMTRTVYVAPECTKLEFPHNARLDAYALVSCRSTRFV